MDFRAIPQNLVMAEAVPFGQRWTYHSPHPMAAMLAPGYFRSEWRRLRPGDDMRICRVERGRLLERANLDVVASGPEGVELALDGEVKTFTPKAEAPAPRPDPNARFINGVGIVEWLGPQKKHGVFVDGNLICDGIPKKADAEAVARGEKPLPAPEAAAA